MKDKGKGQKSTGKKAKENLEQVPEEGRPAICSKSYIVPGNPLAPQNIQNWARHVEELAKTGGRPTEIHLQTPVSRMGRNSPRACSRKGRNSVARVTTPHRKEVPVKNGTLSPIQRKHTILPEIDRKYLARNRSPEISNCRLNPAQLEMPEGAQHIQTTSSAVSFTLYYKPPRRFEPIPRHHSDVSDRSYHRNCDNCLDYTMRTGRVIHRSGGKMMDTIRQTVEGNRRQREQKNMAVTRAKLEERESSVSKIGTAEVTSRVKEVRESQDRLREENYLKSMRKFMTNHRDKK